MEATEEQIASVIARLDGDEWTAYLNRERVVLQMAAMGPKAIPHLARALQSESADVRAGAARALGGIPSDQTVGLLMTPLKDADFAVRVSAAFGLAETGSREAALALARALEVEEDAHVRWVIISTLGQLRMPETEAILLNAVQHEAFMAAWSAATGLAEWNHPQAPSGMLGIVLRATEEELEYYDFWGEAVSVLGKGGVAFIPTLIETLGNDSGFVRSIIVAALGDIGDTSVIPVLLLLLSDPDAIVRSKVVLALGQLRTPSAKAALLPLLDDTPETEDALRAVRTMTNPEIVAACAKCLSSSRRLVTYRAAEALATQGADGIAALIASLQSPNKDSRIAASEGLWHARDCTATEALIQALKDENERVRNNAARALEATADPRAADALLALMDDPVVRRSAAGALGKIGDRRASRVICAMLESGDTTVHRSAILALWDMADLDTYDTLMTACGNEDDFVQERAAMALGWLNIPEAADYLVSMLHHEKSRGARRGAVYALGALGLERTRDELTRAWWEDPDINVFRAATIALERFGSRDLCSPDIGTGGMQVGYGG